MAPRLAFSAQIGTPCGGHKECVPREKKLVIDQQTDFAKCVPGCVEYANITLTEMEFLAVPERIEVESCSKDVHRVNRVKRVQEIPRSV